MGDFKLSASLEGHEDDVRAICEAHVFICRHNTSLKEMGQSFFDVLTFRVLSGQGRCLP